MVAQGTEQYFSRRLRLGPRPKLFCNSCPNLGLCRVRLTDAPKFCFVPRIFGLLGFREYGFRAVRVNGLRV